MDRRNICSGSIGESTIGYSRLVKHGQYAFISGTTSIDENGIVVGSGNSYLQTKHIIQIIEKSLKKISANLTDVVRTRIYVTNIEEWKSIGRAHAFTQCVSKSIQASHLTMDYTFSSTNTLFNWKNAWLFFWRKLDRNR